MHLGIPEGSVGEAASIFIRAYAQSPWNEEWSLDLAFQRVRELLAHPSCIVIRACQEDRLVGFAIGTPHTSAVGPTLYLAELVVDPAVQRRGIGKALLEQMEGEAIQSGYTGMWLVTELAGSTAEFYANPGFRASSRLKVVSKRLSGAISGQESR